ncbi:hypothetical protein HDU96_010703 [Phlyctochytrium bullatum]|nr:hypothetical protein HDU96_010703 [Phlyctochytrium bullatum]
MQRRTLLTLLPAILLILQHSPASDASPAFSLSALLATTKITPSVDYDPTDPVFQTLYPYSVLTGSMMCDPSFLSDVAAWQSAPTLAALKWHPPTIVRAIGDGEGTNRTTSMLVEGLLAGVSWNETTGTAVVAFRGSKGVDNYITDFSALKEETFNNIHVHSGFYQAYKQIEPYIDRELRKVLTTSCPKCDTVAFAGHSLGGALATLATMVYAVNGTLNDRKIRLYTFGSPRVGSVELWDAVKATGKVVEVWRFVNGKDVVPSVPFSRANTPLDEMYTHIPNMHWWPSGEKSIRACNGTNDVDETGAGQGDKCARGSILSPIDHLSFGPFTLGPGVCDMDYSTFLNTIPYHQVYTPPPPVTATAAAGNTAATAGVAANAQTKSAAAGLSQGVVGLLPLAAVVGAAALWAML